jgi:hypothetical protein
MAQQSSLNETPGAPDANGRVSVGEQNAYLADKPERATGESLTEYNKRVTQWYKDQPHNALTPEQAAAGATLQWVRTGIGGKGEYKVVYPIGVAYDKTTGQPLKVPSSGNQKPTLDKTGLTIVSKKPAPGGNGTLVTYKDASGNLITDTEYPEFGSGDGTANLTTNLQTQYQEDLKKEARQSAYDLLLNEFNKYGLGSLVEGIKGLIQENVSPSEFAIRLQNTDAYKQRFAANQDRIKQGLRALTPAEYIGLEDQYQNIMRNYGLPASYYSKDSMGTQAGFNKFIANDVSAAELEDRIATAQKRVINSDPAVLDALRQFYPDINTSDLLAYTLDPTNALENIKRKVTAAEIGGAALGQGLDTNVNRAEELAKYGVTKAQAQQGYATIGEFLPTATQLGDIYAKQGLGAYNQATAESEIFNTANAADAARKRKKLAQLEQASFGGAAGTAQGALARDRAGNF